MCLILLFQLSKPPMGNKLGHGESATSGGGGPGPTEADSSSAASAARPPLSRPSSGTASAAVLGTHTKKGNKAGNPDPSGNTAQDLDTNDDQVAEVPPPMEPMAPMPVNSVGGLGSGSGGGGEVSTSGGGETPDHNKPNQSCDSNDEGGPGASAGVITADSVEKAIQERSYRLQELLDSERVYVCDLEHCCQYIQYMRQSKEQEDHEIPMPEDLRDGKDRMIFGNIEAIYEWHRE